MKEYNEINKGEDALGGETQLTKIDKRLAHIEELLEKISKRSQIQLTYSLGFGGIAVGAGMTTAGAVASGYDPSSLLLCGVFIFFLGVATMLLSSMRAN